MKDLREIQDADGVVWQVQVATRRTGGTVAENAPRPPSYRVLRFHALGGTGDDDRCAEYRNGWDDLPAEQLLEILTTEATPCSDWA
jgi:hypothetical protein